MKVFDEGEAPPYGVALVGIILVILLSASSGDNSPVGAIALLMQGAVLIFVLRISGVSGHFWRIAMVLTVLLVTAGVASILIEGDSATGATEIVGLLFAVATPIAIGRRVRREGRVDATVVAGALCIYLLLGLFYVQVFSLTDRVSDGQFFVQIQDPSPADMAYFSYVTMTTVGYGDLTAAGDVERMIAVTEALIGQLYLVTIVALAVSRFQPFNRGRGSVEHPAPEGAPTEPRDTEPDPPEAGP